MKYINNFIKKIKKKIFYFYTLYLLTLNYLISYIYLFNKKYFLNNLKIPNYKINNVIYINPNKINLINSVPIKFNKSTNFIINSDWKNKQKKVSDHILDHHSYVTCNEIFLKKMNYTTTKEYYFFNEKINRGINFKGCKNLQDVDLYFINLKKLYESISKNGYKNSNSLNKIGISKEIEFMVDSKDNLVKINSGNHRFAISKILKLDLIPISVNLIHIDSINRYQFNKKISFYDNINEYLINLEKKYK